MIQALRDLYAGLYLPFTGRNPSRLPMPIIVGAPRSGTTLLRLMLDSHPEMAIPPETGFLPKCARLAVLARFRRVPPERLFEAITEFPPEAPGWRDFHIPREAFLERIRSLGPFTVADGCREFYALYAAHLGKRRWGEKTPLYCRHLLPIQALLPESRFLHIIRDGRDVASSLRKMWFSPAKDVASLARYWRDCVVGARRQGALCRYYAEVRYENLVLEPAATLRKICEFLELPYCEAMLGYFTRAPERLDEHEGRVDKYGTVLLSKPERLRQHSRTMLPPDASRVDNWKSDMRPAEIREFSKSAGRTLAALGYEA